LCAWTIRGLALHLIILINAGYTFGSFSRVGALRGILVAFVASWNI
jgi:hypothetical protein